MSTVTNQTTSATLKPKQKVPFYISRNYAFLWGGQAISNLGDLIFDVTLTLWIATDIARGQSWGPLAMGGGMLCVSIPALLIGPLAGVFVDRWDKRRTMIWTDMIRAICVLLLLLVVIPLPFLPSGYLSPLAQIGAIYLVILLTTACSLFFGPARSSIIQSVVDEKEFERASGLAMVTQNISRIIGPTLAAPTLFIFGIHWALLLNAASFLISAAAIKQVQIGKQTKVANVDISKAGFWNEFKEGLYFLAKNRVLLVILIALSVAMIGDAADEALGVFFMLNNLHVPTYLYGIIGTIGGSGGILGALLAPFVVRRIGSIRSFWLGTACFGFMLFVFSRMSLFVPALVLIFLAGFPIAASNVAVGPLLLRLIPRYLLGRVNAAFSTCLSIFSIFAVSLISILASALHSLHANLVGLWFGPYDAILSVGGLLTLFVGFGVAISLRKVSLASQMNQEDVSEQKEEL